MVHKLGFSSAIDGKQKGNVMQLLITSTKFSTFRKDLTCADSIASVVFAYKGINTTMKAVR